MKVDPKKHSLTNDIKSKNLRGYIGICASFAMRLWARPQAAEYFIYDKEDGTKVNDDDPLYSQWRPASWSDF